MVNHLRTLILNSPGPGGTPFDQFVPEGFRGASLNADETRVRNLIVHPDAPRDFLEFAATAATRIVHGTPFWEKFIAPIDPRETIDWEQNQTGVLAQRISLEKVVGSSMVDVFGTFSPDIDGGVFSNSWRITSTSNSSATVEDKRLGTSRVESLTFSGGASNEIRLEPRSRLWFRFTNQPSVFPVISVVTASASPRLNPLHLLARFRQEARVRPFITALGIPELLSAYDDRISPINAVAAVICAYGISISRRVFA